MNILVLQLARHGDIFQTWPVLRALKRTYPEANIRFLVKERYRDAAPDGAWLTTVAWPTADILAPLLENPTGTQNERIDAALSRLQATLQSVKVHGPFDLIVNLSFSPLSGFLVQDFKSETTMVRGYDRHPDGFLSLPDDTSAYFYAQGGVQGPNRIHLIDLMASVAGVQLEAGDFTEGSPQPLAKNKYQGTDYIVVHLGASQVEKTVPASVWLQFLRSFLRTRSESVYLVGTRTEALQAQTQADLELLTHPRVTDLCGRTQLDELFPLLRTARAAVGADSMVLQIANLTGTPAVNVTFPSVKFWETGPRVQESLVVPFLSPERVSPLTLRQQVARLLDGEEANVYQARSGFLEAYWPGQDPFSDVADLKWQVCRAIYLDHELDVDQARGLKGGVEKIIELCGLAEEQIQKIAQSSSDVPMASGILDQIDHLLLGVRQHVPGLDPLIQWFFAEKTRIPPGDLAHVLTQTQNVFLHLQNHARRLVGGASATFSSERADLSWK
jgi:heptosyltransferase III